MSVTAQQVVQRVRTQLIDPDGSRWSDAELLRWLSDGMRTIHAARPSLFSEIVTMPLVAGTKQTIPADGSLLIGINRNMAGNAAGRAVRIVSREVMDAFNPNWHSSAASATVQNYMYDSANPTEFYVFPPNTGTGSVEISYARIPAEVTSVSTVLPLFDYYVTALADYVLFRANQKDGDFAAGQSIAQTYLTSFAQFLGVTVAGLTQDDASRNLRPGMKADPA